MPNVLSADSSFLAATARYEKWKAKFLEKWEQPLTDARLIAWWYQQPPAIHAQMAIQSPEAHAKVAARVKEIEDRRDRNNGKA